MGDEQFEQAEVLNPSIAQCARVVFEYGSECGGYWT